MLHIQMGSKTQYLLKIIVNLEVETILDWILYQIYSHWRPLRSVTHSQTTFSKKPFYHQR